MILTVLFPPTPANADPATRAAEFAGHALLGAALVVLFPAWQGLTLGLTIGAGYWLWKERPDIKAGGGVRDGLIDAGAVWLGTYYGPPWWPALVGVLAVLPVVKAWVKR